MNDADLVVVFVFFVHVMVSIVVLKFTTCSLLSRPRYAGTCTGDATRLVPSNPLNPSNPSNPSRNVEVEGKTKKNN